MHTFLRGLFAVVLTAAVSAVGGRVTAKNKGWYRSLRKSRLSPPDRTFAWVWPVLYGLGAWSFVRVASSPPGRRRTAALGLWLGQLAANAAWSPLFFGAHRPRLAFAALAANAVALASYAGAARRIDPAASAMVLPNLGWLGFAGVLNAAVIQKNGWRLQG